jgi:lipopolysaccharide/colanic/teichoic acid biosynthesis glycosyltransferase
MHVADGSLAATARYPGTFVALTRQQLLLKRALDLLLGIPLLALCAPLWIVCTIWIRATSPGPALFQQTRVGHRGHEFVLHKFRSMVLCSEHDHREFTRQWIRDGESARQQNGSFKLEHDSRITQAGGFLRKYSLDELPQLLNVLLGEMSLVGPRPAMAYEVAEYAPWQRDRLSAPPGITGLWQVSGRNQLSFARMVELDLEYIRSWTVMNDIRILFRTIPAVLFGTGH